MHFKDLEFWLYSRTSDGRPGSTARKPTEVPSPAVLQPSVASKPLRTPVESLRQGLNTAVKASGPGSPEARRPSLRASTLPQTPERPWNSPGRPGRDRCARGRCPGLPAGAAGSGPRPLVGSLRCLSELPRWKASKGHRTAAWDSAGPWPANLWQHYLSLGTCLLLSCALLVGLLLKLQLSPHTRRRQESEARMLPKIKEDT